MTTSPDIALSPEALVAARQAAGLSQREAAKAAGIVRATLQFAEAGRRTPQLEHVAALAHVYGVTVDSLLTVDAALIRERAHGLNVPDGHGCTPPGPSPKTTAPDARQASRTSGADRKEG